MYRATTPVHVFTLPVLTNTLKDIQVIYKQGETELLKYMDNNILPPGMTLDGKDVIISLTQNETKLFEAGKTILAQIRVLTNDGAVMASQQFKISVKGVLNEDNLT